MKFCLFLVYKMVNLFQVMTIRIKLFSPSIKSESLNNYYKSQMTSTKFQINYNIQKFNDQNSFGHLIIDISNLFVICYLVPIAIGINSKIV